MNTIARCILCKYFAKPSIFRYIYINILLILRLAIVDVIKILDKLLTPTVILIGIEDNKPKAIKALQQATATIDKIKVCIVPTKYPTGGEKQLTDLPATVHSPSWSPDGEYLAYIQEGSKGSQVNVLDMEGGQSYLIADAFSKYSGLVWIDP